MKCRDDSSLSFLKVLFFILCFCLTIPAFAQNARTYPIDVIVLLDTSSSMSAFYHEVSDYLTGPFLREQVRLADTFHLISFSDTARLEIVRRVMDRSDVEVIIGRLLLMYPLGPYSDIDKALHYAESYSNTLTSGRQKRLVLITDGDHHPPAGTAANVDIEERIGTAQAALQRAGVSLTVVKVPDGLKPVTAQRPAPEPSRPAATTPEPEKPKEQRPAASEPASRPATVEQPATATPEPEKPKEQRPPPPEPHSPPSLAVKPVLIPPPVVNATPEPEASQPDSLAVQGLSPELPAESEPRLAFPPGPDASEERIAVQRIVQIVTHLGGFVVLASVFSLFLLLLRLKDSPLHTIITAAETVSRLSRNDPFQAIHKNIRTAPLTRKVHSLFKNEREKDNNLSFDGPPLLSLFVTDQNTQTGRRNLHTIKRGYSLTLGGGNSDFLIFLVPVPAHIASIYFDGKHCSFIPKKRQFFPDIGSTVLLNCIEKPIKIASGKNYELKIYIERYEDPLKTLNRLLRSVYIP
ncbi:MAG: VWA domain-containing protein [Spirochaetaceae bacterium]|jgi:hypothetical protein|nr:VWA domain-containing protein [Spirochaetaceae bacterium]